MAVRTMKVLVVHNFYQQHGGEQAAVQAHVQLLRQHGHDTVLYARHNSEITGYGAWEKAAFSWRTLYSRKTYEEVSALVRQERPDVVHVHNVFPLITPAVYRALRKAGVPVVQTVHNFRFLCPNGLFYTQGHICERCKRGNTSHAVPRRCFRGSYVLTLLYALTVGLHRRLGTFEMIDRYIALTEFTVQKLVEGHLASEWQIPVLGNPLPPLPLVESCPGRDAYVLYLGRLSTEKGVPVLLGAIAELPGLKLKIAGDGPQARPLRSLARQQGLQQVEFLGRVEGSDRWQLLQDAIATVVPSLCYETFGLTALESLAVGTPVVASKLGSLCYLVHDGETGLLFRPGDTDDLKRNLAWLCAHPEEAQRMGERGRRIVETEYSVEAHYDKLMGIYREVAS